MTTNYATIQERSIEPSIARDKKLGIQRVTFEPWVRIFEPMFFRPATAAAVASGCAELVRQAPEGTERRVSLWRSSKEFGDALPHGYHVIGESTDDTLVVPLEVES